MTVQGVVPLGGSTFAPLTMSPGLFGAPEVVGNGIITRRTSGDGCPREQQLGVSIRIDLDGNRLRSLVGDGVRRLCDLNRSGRVRSG